MRKHLTSSSYITGEKASMSSFTWHVPSRLFSFVGGQGKVAGDYDETKETTGDGQVSSFTIFFFLSLNGKHERNDFFFKSSLTSRKN